MQKNYKGALYQFTATGLLFPSLVTNHTNQIFITCRKLNRAKIALINGKILNIFGVINLDKINNWENIKGKPVWLNTNFQELKHKKSDNFSFSFETLHWQIYYLFSIHVIESDSNKTIFKDSEKKISTLNFKTDIYQ